MGPRSRANALISSRVVIHCAVSMNTEPSRVNTRLGLQPRIFVVVKTCFVTCSSSMADVTVIAQLSFLSGNRDARRLVPVHHGQPGNGDAEARNAFFFECP